MERQPYSTTQAQVSGHKFLQRRMHHGLVLGDVRMIHDPLARRGRAAIMGSVAAVLVGAGAGLFAWLAPDPDPGDAAVWQGPGDQMYVHLEGTAYPVPNVTSAQLIVGENAVPAKVGQSVLARTPVGPPLGLPQVPRSFVGFVSTDDAQSSPQWSVCHDEARVVVQVGQRPADWTTGKGVLAVTGGEEYLVDSAQRMLLPPADTVEGRAVRRAVGIGAQTPQWQAPAGMLAALRQGPDIQIPEGDVVDTGEDLWLVDDRSATHLTEVQARAIEWSGRPRRVGNISEIAELEQRAELVYLPAAELEFVDPNRVARAGAQPTPAICVVDGVLAQQTEVPPGVQVVGESEATHFVAPGLVGAAVVDTGFGFVGVSASGMRHEFLSAADVAVVTEAEPVRGPHDIVTLLPAGEKLDPAKARRATGY